MVKINMNQQRKLSRHNSRQSSIGETTSVGSTKSAKSNGSSDYNNSSPIGQQQQLSANNKSNGLSKHGSQESNDSGTGTQPTNILNVAEMLLHGVADNEILDIWLRSIHCEEFVAKFIDAGYDMPTISRITPQDLTAIGVTDPSKRLKILTEIKKLNLQDGIPNFKPANLSHWLSLIRLDSYYYKSLCDQQVDTIEKMCQLTWEDFEELGITKLGHQKRFQLAIERVKGLEIDAKFPSKPMSEPIYDTNPSQILLVASSENHSMNGPIINKQSSTSELSSTGSGSMHSVYSAASAHHQSTYAPLPDNQQSIIVSQTQTAIGNHNQLPHHHHFQHHQQQPQQAIYSQPPPPPSIYQQPPLMAPPVHQQQKSHYQQHQQAQLIQMQQTPSSQLTNNNITNESINSGGNGMVIPQQNRQSMSQLPFRALANLPKHQQQLLQQSSIYATLSRQPSKAKQPPPPVPIRTNSLKSNSLTDETNKHHQSTQQQQTNYQSLLNNCHTISTTSLFRSGTRVSNKNQFNSQTMLTKNKSFSGNAHMEASRAKFLNRNSQQSQQQQQQQQQQFSHLPQQIQTIINQNNGGNCSNQNFVYGTNSNAVRGNMLNGHSNDDNQLSSSTHDSGSSQTLYNSISSGSNDQSLNNYNTSQPGELIHRSVETTASSCTLNDANLILERHFSPTKSISNTHCNATTGKDDDFPPPPSPLSLTDEHDLVSLNSDSNFTDLSHGLMTFRVGI